MPCIDLHLHSIFSDDGELAPEKIVQNCQENNINLIAITDHNSIKGVQKAQDFATNIKVLSGVELDCTFCGKGFHLLGYNFDYTLPKFLQIEQDILLQEQSAAKEKFKLFADFSKIPMDLESTLAKATDGVITGELIAEILLSLANAANYELLLPYLPGGAKSDMPNVRFYWDFFSQGKVAYVPINYISLQNAVDLIHKAGGIAVLAHPAQNLAGDDSLLEKIIACGIDGLEAFSSYHSPEVARHYEKIAIAHNLVVTCGSDFHGKHKPNITLSSHNAPPQRIKVLLDFFQKIAVF